jgi:hypothetical protein
MSRKIVFLFIALIIAFSGCTDSLGPDPVDQEGIYYEPPADYYSLQNHSENGSEFVYSYNTPLDLESLEVWNIDANYTREEYLNQSKSLVEISSSSFFNGNVTSVKVDNESEYLWTRLNGTAEVDSEDGIIRGREYIFTAYHEKKIYIFTLIDVTRIGDTEYEPDEYDNFAQSVKNTEFR